MKESFVVAPDVRASLEAGRAVVALESTLVTHGLPPPDGLRVAAELEDEVRAAGALPATVGVLEGALRVGLTPEELARLAATPKVTKLNPGNLAAHVAAGASGSTTVAATMLAAARAGIRVFATGGIGGVHRDAAETGDVSADVFALARHPVAVVCAGAKAVLDLPRTVELLETLGVPVIGLGTDEFPSFYRRGSGLPVDARVETIAELAAVVRAHFELGEGGVLVANPIPVADELPEDVYEPALRQALREVGERGIRGRAVTPFLLDRLRESTGGRSVTANLALLRNDARVAGSLAVELAGSA